MSGAPLMWTGSVAIANVGLDGEAIMGPKWENTAKSSCGSSLACWTTATSVASALARLETWITPH